MANQIVVEMTGQEAKLWQSLQKVTAQQAKMEQGFKKTGQTARDTGTKMKTAGDQGSKAFGAAEGSLTKFAAGFVGISAAVSTVTQLLNNMAQTAEEAATKAKESVIGAGTLANLAKSPEEFTAMLAEGRTSYASGVGRSETEAMDLMYQLQAAGFDKKDRDLLNKMASVGHTKTNEVLTMVGALKGFGLAFGTKETGSVQDLVNKANLAAGSTTTSAAGMLGAIVKSAGSAASLGLSDEELLAFLGTGTAIESDPRLASTKINAFLSKMAGKEEFEGKGMSLKEIVETIQGMGMKRAELEIFTGGIRGIAGYEYIAKSPELMGQYETMLGEMEVAVEEDLLSDQLKFYEHDPKLKRSIDATAAEHEAEMSRDKLSQYKNLADTVLNKYEVERRKQEGGFLPAEWDISLARWQAGIERKVVGDEGWLRRHAGEIEDPAFREDVRGMVGPRRVTPAGLVFKGGLPLARDLWGEMGMGLPTEGPGIAAPAAPAAENIHDWQPDMAAAAGDIKEASQAIRDGSRGPTLVPPNVDR